LPGLAGVLRRDASFTNLDLGGRLEESCPAAKLSKIPPLTHSGKREEEKPQKRRKEKGLLFQSGGDGLSRFCWRKLCPQGFIFDGQTAQPPDLDGPSETGYLCGSFCFWWIINVSCTAIYKKSYLCSVIHQNTNKLTGIILII